MTVVLSEAFGEIGAVMRSRDWAATALGPAERWPQSLRSVLSVGLTARLPTLVWWGPDLALLYNDAARSELGLAGREGGLGMPAQQAWPEAWPSVGPVIRRVLEQGEPAWVEDQTLPTRKDGSWSERSFSASYSPIQDEAGRVGGVFCTLVATEAALRRSEAQYRALTELSLHMVWTLSPAGEITYLSQKWFDYTGLSRDEVRASGWQRALHPDEREAIAAAFGQHLVRGEEYAMELRLRARDGSYRWHLTQAAPIKDARGAVQRWLGVTFDIDQRKRAEEALRASEERYRSLTHILTSIVWQTDASGAFVAPQPEWAAYTGQRWEAHRGWGWADALHPDDREPTRARWRRALDSGGRYEARGRIWHAPSGGYRHFFAQGAPLRDRDGAVRAWIGTITDTHEQELRERDGRFLADLAERVRLASAAGELLVAVARAVAEHLQVRRCLIIDIDVPADRAVVRAEHCRGVPSVPHEYRVSDYSAAARAEMEAGRMIVNEDARADPRTAAIYAATYAPAGERSYVAVPLMRDGHWNGTMWISDDVPRAWEPRELALLETAAERVWLAVEKLRAEQALREHADQLLELYTAAQRAISVRDQFLSVAAHELKTPLTALLGYSQTLLRRAVREGTLGERDQRVLRQTAEQALRLNRLIDALLDVTRIESGRLSIERRELDLSALLQRSVEALRATVDQHALELAGADEPLLITGDELRLEQVIQNLLSNAVKYSPMGGTVRVTLARDGGEVQIAVSDEGVGIPAAEIPQLFQRFYRVDDVATRHIAGMGIGLYVVKEIVGLHGGSVAIQSVEGAGSTFLISLPAGEDDHAEPDR